MSANAFRVWLLLAAFAPVARARSAAVQVVADAREAHPATPHPATIGAGLELNRLLRQSRLRALTPAEVSAGISQLGTPVLASALQLLEERTLPAVDGADLQILSELQQAQVLDGLRGLSQASVLDGARLYLEQHGGERASFGTRAAVTLVAGTVGSFQHLRWACSLFPEKGPGDLDSRAESALISAAKAILYRDRDALGQLALGWRGLPAKTVPALLSGAGGLGDARALPFITEVLEERPALAPIALAEISRQRAPDEIPAELVGDLRALLDPAHPATCQAACNALASLGDFGCVDEMVELLAGPGDGVIATAHRALQSLTGLKLPAQASGWKSWRTHEKAWFTDRGRSLTAAVDSKDEKVAMAALLEIAEHRWERHRLSRIVARTLDRRERALRLRACEILQLLDSPRALEPLARAAKCEDPSVAAAAQAAWQAMQGLDPRGRTRDAIARRE